MKPIRLSVTLLLAGASAWAQSTPRPQFEVASIKPSPPQMPNMAAVGIKIDGAQVRVAYLPLSDYLAMAYRVKINQINGPEWLTSERFDINAKIPEGVKSDQIPEMLQSLIEERFHMKARREKKEFPVYGLLVAKGGLKVQALPEDPNETPPNSFEATGSGGPSGITVSFGRGSSFSLANNQFLVKKLNMNDFADTLTRFTDRPVVNMTDAPGRFDFTVNMTPEDYRSILIRSAVNAGVTLPPEALKLLEGFTGEGNFLALQSVGLKLESRKAPLDVLVVESISKAPTEN